MESNSEVAHCNVDFEYSKFKWDRIPKLIFKIIKLLYRKSECNHLEYKHIDRKNKLTTESHISEHLKNKSYTLYKFLPSLFFFKEIKAGLS